MYRDIFLYTKFSPHFSGRINLLQNHTKLDNHTIMRGSNVLMLVRQDDKN